MPKFVNSFTTWMHKWKTILGAVVIVFGGGVFWGVVKQDTAQMRADVNAIPDILRAENETNTQIIRVEMKTIADATDMRLKAVEKKVDRADIDHDLLIRIDQTVTGMAKQLERLDNKRP